MIKHEGRVYTVYKHTNKKNGKVYIGLTCQTPERRWQKGVGYAKTIFGAAIRKYGWDAFQHEIIATELTELEACELEISKIAEYRSNERGYGYNASAGGEVTDCITKRYGKDNNKAVAVNRISPKTGEQKHYDSIADATREMGINHRGISKACRGAAKTYMGYVWEYADRDFQKEEHYARGKYPHVKQQRKIVVSEPSGDIIRFEGINEACQAYQIGRSSAYRYLNMLQFDPSGKVWMYG